jgi:hypothetical protein
VDRFTKDPGRVTLVSVPWIAVAVALGVLSAVALSLARAGGGPLGAATVVFVLATLAALSRAHRDLLGKVETNADGVWLGGKLLVPRAALREGRSRTGDGARGDRERLEAWAELRGPLVTVRVHTDDWTEAEQALDPLGFSARRARAAYLFLPRTLGRRAAIVFATIAVGAVIGRALSGGASRVAQALSAVVLAGTLASFRLLRASACTVTVGNDGISLQEHGKRRFLPWSDVEALSAEDAAVSLRLRSGESFTLIPYARSERSAMARDFVRRAEAARNAGPAAVEDGAAGAAALLARGGRTTREWIAALRALGDAREGYRSVGVPRERLVALVTDGTARIVDRVAAAVALRGVLEDEERERLRVAADASASQELGSRIRVVLDAEDDALIARALADAEAEAGAEVGAATPSRR